MLRIVLFIIILLHALIHFMGFTKAFGYGNMQQLKLPISKTTGLLWLAIAFLFIIAAVLFLQHKQGWWMVAIPTAILSQIIITMSWQDAKAGTIANIIILIAAFLSFTSYRFENTFKKDVKKNLEQNNALTKELLTTQDLTHLPLPVQKYLHYTGVVNKPKVKSVRVVFEGQMRDKGKDYFPFLSEQYNFFNEPTRLFFMKAKMFGVTVPGYHHYIKANAVMDIRLFGLFPVVQKSGAVMNKTETVTLFNDMCLLAPATLIDKRIQWLPINDTSVTAIFTNHDITITANLFFNQQGQLVNFISNDRVSVNEMKAFPFSTPVASYKNVNGYTIMSVAEAVWHYENGAFTYGKFNLLEVEYNVQSFK
ncbi:MAG: DUF6544 family protein [Bacteroidota bacterium]